MEPRGLKSNSDLESSEPIAVWPGCEAYGYCVIGAEEMFGPLIATPVAVKKGIQHQARPALTI